MLVCVGGGGGGVKCARSDRKVRLPGGKLYIWGVCMCAAREMAKIEKNGQNRDGRTFSMFSKYIREIQSREGSSNFRNRLIAFTIPFSFIFNHFFFLQFCSLLIVILLSIS